ncbi:MAG: class I adenylate-forming enzyme family protein [Pseudomonadota bacterium]
MSWFNPTPLLLPQIIADHGRHRPEHPALKQGDRTLSWRQFADHTARVANAIRNLGVQPGQRVGVLMDASMATVEAMFGIVRSGAVAVPLNVSISDDAVAAMLNDSEAVAVIATPAQRQRIDRVGDQLQVRRDARVVAGESPQGWINFEAWRNAASSVAPAPVTDPDAECNLIYSSGTTGLPKGIVHSHRCRAAWAYNMAVGLRYHSGARTLLSLGLYSNITWVAMLSTMLAGGTLVIMPKFDCDEFLRLTEAEKITHSVVVPVQLQRLLDHPGFAADRVVSFQSLMCCGSPLPGAIKTQIVEAFGAAFMELYGLTEGLVTILAPEQMESHIDSVGLPCPGQRIKILGGDDQECPTGESGEIIGLGPLQMAGYHNRADANEETTWVDRQGQRWLRTGDIGRLDDAGFLYLVDRKKDMILSGGQNIYPADIEAVIARHPLVAECAVIGVPSDTWGETPLALLVLREDADDEFNHTEVRTWINEQVGKQQRVAGVVRVGDLPRNPNGKILKRELRKSYADWRADA